MAAVDAEVYDVNMVGVGGHLMLPAVAGKRIRVWRITVGFTNEANPDNRVIVTFNDGVSTMAGNFPVYHRSTLPLDIGVKSWITVAAGRPLYVNFSDYIECNGSFAAEYIT